MSTNIQTPQEHMKEYASKIKQKHLDFKKQKEHLLSVLWSDEEKQKEQIDKDFKIRLREYVQELKSTEEHEEQAELYHEQMQDVRDFFHLIFDIDNPANKEKIKEMFVASKQYFQGVDKKDWDTNYIVLEKFLEKITPEERSEMMDSISLRAKDPKILSKELDNIIKANTKMSDKIWKIIMQIDNKRKFEFSTATSGKLFAASAIVMAILKQLKYNDYIGDLPYDIVWAISIPLALIFLVKLGGDVGGRALSYLSSKKN